MIGQVFLLAQLVDKLAELIWLYTCHGISDIGPNFIIQYLPGLCNVQLHGFVVWRDIVWKNNPFVRIFKGVIS